MTLDRHTSMTVISAPEQTDTSPPTIHDYPKDRRYRLSGTSPPQIGDIARCGHRKKKPPRNLPLSTPITCVVCRELYVNGVLP